MTPKYKYYTEASGRGANRPGAARCEAILTDWFETQMTVDEIRVKYGATVNQSITRVILRAIRRKPELLGIRNVTVAKNFISCDNFNGGTGRGLHYLKPEIKEAIRKLRAQGLTYRQIADELKIGFNTAWRHANNSDYRPDRADPTEPYGQPHA